MTQRLIIVDQDAGSDDAHALFLLADADRHQEIKLMGVTCVNGNTSLENVCINALRTLRSINRLDIPVYSGATEPLILPKPAAMHFNPFHGKDGFGDANLPCPPDPSLIQAENAVSALQRIVADNPGKITLICLGPLTNIALAIKTYPNFSKNLKEVYIMGGNSSGVGNTTPSAEFNFYHDPEAAHIVLECLKCPIFVLPWEPCIKKGIPMEWRMNILGAIDSPQIQLMNAVEHNIWKDHNEWLPCDALLAAYALQPRIGKGKHHHMSVELGGWKTRGQAVIDHGHEKPNVFLLEDIDLDILKDLYNVDRNEKMPQEKKTEEVEIHIAESGDNKEESITPECEEISSKNLTAENGVLRRSLNERECEIQRLQGKLSNGSTYGNIFMGVGRASELAASKIVELTKKVRELTAELEGERARRRKLMDAVKDNVKGNTRGGKLAQRKKHSEAKKNCKNDSETEEKEDDVKSLKEKLQTANMKIAEWQNHCLSLKQELKIADKILASEVGDGCTVEVAKVSMALQNPAYGGNGGWRGRAQQLTLLRSRLSEMEEKLKNPERWSIEGGLEENGEWKKEREKWSQETERLRKAVGEAEKTAEEWRRKAEVSRARCGSLRAEAEAVKARMATIISKGDHDDQLIASLNELQAVCQTAEAERLRLMELATVLNQRLENERTKAVNVFKELQIERRKNAKLETKIARMELESASSRSRAYGWSSSRRLSNCTEKESIPGEVKFRLEILEEEKLVLESKINSLQQEKEYDLRKYLAMIEETREFYLSKFGQLENAHHNKNNLRRNPLT
ncbi:hypothetical protein J437_LFUL008327 [Ladona fulva]|uniref:Inosine/uridine-preferring nucleoside hydrolase domain-containing protein n=1 Tax=Ladona fulva TaxID=123851 RepID=A0A8K0P0E1_LADFU|nr:hypothetical protein J437_LFUL008327 [Ladona fulva]